jgi:hypothetical protein
MCSCPNSTKFCSRAEGCFVRIYGNNPDYLEVTVDTHGMGPIVVLADVSFDVTFLLRRTDTKTSYDFTNDDHGFLEAQPPRLAATLASLCDDAEMLHAEPI